MDNNTLTHELTQIIKTYHAVNVRYKHFAISSKELAALSPLSLILRDLLPEYSFWNGNEPESNNAPPALCHRSDFINAAFKESHHGLIIYQPAYWLQTWKNSDKQAFWSALSARHGGHNVIIIMPESDEFKRLNINYFNDKPVDGLPLT
ncbi:MAG: hypothetical protein GQ569_05955, partial [Methylococcaceae bacterium]|nr:hypothetical protein [Methylococcaceae bacterium]